jgi:hypothetical protein
MDDVVAAAGAAPAFIAGGGELNWTGCTFTEEDFDLTPRFFSVACLT